MAPFNPFNYPHSDWSGMLELLDLLEATADAIERGDEEIKARDGAFLARMIRTRAEDGHDIYDRLVVALRHRESDPQDTIKHILAITCTLFEDGFLAGQLAESFSYDEVRAQGNRYQEISEINRASARKPREGVEEEHNRWLEAAKEILARHSKAGHDAPSQSNLARMVISRLALDHHEKHVARVLKKKMEH